MGHYGNLGPFSTPCSLFFVVSPTMGGGTQVNPDLEILRLIVKD